MVCSVPVSFTCGTSHPESQESKAEPAVQKKRQRSHGDGHARYGVLVPGALEQERVGYGRNVPLFRQLVQECAR